VCRCCVNYEGPERMEARLGMFNKNKVRSNLIIDQYHSTFVGIFQGFSTLISHCSTKCCLDAGKCFIFLSWYCLIKMAKGHLPTRLFIKMDQLVGTSFGPPPLSLDNTNTENKYPLVTCYWRLGSDSRYLQQLFRRKKNIMSWGRYL